MSPTPAVAPHSITDALVDAYAARDAALVAALMRVNVEVRTPPHQCLHPHRAELKHPSARHPNGSTEVVHRVALGTNVADHQRVRRAPNATAFDVLTIDTLEAGAIAAVSSLADVPVGR